MTKKVYVCRECGGDNVVIDAFAEWDVQAQVWDLRSTFDHAECTDCEGETRLKEVAILYSIKFDVGGVAIIRESDGASVYLQGDDRLAFEKATEAMTVEQVQALCAEYDSVMERAKPIGKGHTRFTVILTQDVTESAIVEVLADSEAEANDFAQDVVSGLAFVRDDNVNQRPYVTDISNEGAAQ
jgi:hypothetical protein